MFALRPVEATQRGLHVFNMTAKGLSAEVATALSEFMILLHKLKWPAYKAITDLCAPFSRLLGIFPGVGKNWSWKPAKSTASILKLDVQELFQPPLPVSDLVSGTPAQRIPRISWHMVRNYLLVAVEVNGVGLYPDLMMKQSSSGRRLLMGGGCLDIDFAKRRPFEQLVAL